MLAQERAAFESGIKTESQKASDEMAASKQKLQLDTLAANSAAADIQKKAQLDMAASNAAAASENAAMVQNSYGVNTAQVTPANAQVTKPVVSKKPEKESLKIAAGSVATTAGSGLNIGV